MEFRFNFQVDPDAADGDSHSDSDDESSSNSDCEMACACVPSFTRSEMEVSMEKENAHEEEEKGEEKKAWQVVFSGDVSDMKEKEKAGMEIEVDGFENIKIVDAEVRDAELKAITDETDLKPGVYEGGFKIWEGSMDLLEYMVSSRSTLFGDTDGTRKLKILELGCGHGIPGLFCLNLNQHGVECMVDFCDFNEDVLRSVTRPNVLLNSQSPSPSRKMQHEHERARYFAGDWNALPDLDTLTHHSYDLILSAETIYSIPSQLSLMHSIKTLLSPTGSALIAAKVEYFGVYGTLADFKKHAVESGLVVERVWRIEDGVSNIREIVKLTFPPKPKPTPKQAAAATATTSLHNHSHRFNFDLENDTHTSTTSSDAASQLQSRFKSRFRFNFRFTGFEKFAGCPSNHTAKLACKLKEEMQMKMDLKGYKAKAEFQFQCDELETSYQACSDYVGKMKMEKEEEEEDMVVTFYIHFGIDMSASTISFEKYGTNVAQYRVKDEHGDKLNGSVDEGDEFGRTLESTIPVADLVKYINAEMKRDLNRGGGGGGGVSVSVSESAGHFVCNTMYYLSLANLQSSSPSAHSLFIHVPPVSTPSFSFNEQLEFFKYFVMVLMKSVEWSV